MKVTLFENFMNDNLIEVNAENFFLKTTGTWCLIDVRHNAKTHFNELVKKYKLNYNSPSGSQYVTTDDGVYRFSDHWGRVATCNWLLDKNIPKWLDGEFFLAYINYSDLVSHLKTIERYKVEWFNDNQKCMVINYIEKDMIEKVKHLQNFRILGVKSFIE